MRTDLSVPSYSGTAASPQRRYADLDLELWSPSNVKVASTYSTTARPETLNYANAPPGNYTLKVISKDYDASYTLNSTYQIAGYADLTTNLKNPSGTTVATTRSATGSSSLSYLTPSGGNYTLKIVNNSTDLNVPSYSDPWSLNSTMTLALKDSGGQVIEQVTGTVKPKTITRTMTPGTYTISATPTGGIGTATVTASYPGRPLREVITYDGNDHATSIDDGTNKIEETLPSGRVLRRVVKDAATNQVLEDVVFGYDWEGDSPSYSKPNAGGAITTYINGPGGLLVIYIGGTATYPIQNGHGDVVGTADSAGTFTAAPPTDEFGVGTAPTNRLGWLGGYERFALGGTLGLKRMGVRLYDSRLGRFLQVDPVEGGSANDYDYAYQDPVNTYDLDGRAARCRNVFCSAGRWMKKHRRLMRNIISAASVVTFAACIVISAGACAVAGLAVAGSRLLQARAERGRLRKSDWAHFALDAGFAYGGYALRGFSAGLRATATARTGKNFVGLGYQWGFNASYGTITGGFSSSVFD